MLSTSFADRPAPARQRSSYSQALRYVLLLVLALAASTAAHAQEVDHRPVVLTGADLPALIGADVTAPICYAFRDGAWAQCPLQIDERAMLDPATNYPTSVSDAGELYGGPPQLLYTAPQDYPMPGFTPIVPVDPAPQFDADDELVLMARYFGDVVSPAAPPFAPSDVIEVLFEGRAAYVFVPTQPLAQDAGVDLVSYSFDLLAGDFPSAYNFEGDTTLPDEWGEGDYLAANPEFSPVETAYYKSAFEDRWIQRSLSLTDGQGDYGPDILDRVKYGTRPNTMGNNNKCGRSIWTGSARRGTLGIQKDGPIRALRWIQGFNSGGLNYVLYTMYDRYITFQMAHQMHRSPGASMWFDLAPEAVGMRHRSNLFSGAVTVDGVPDRTGNGFVNAYLEWDHFAGAQGSFVSVWEADTNIPSAFPHSYYEDDTTPEVRQCTGDDVAYASSGNVYIFGDNVDDAYVPWTDPPNPASFDNEGNLRFLRIDRRMVPGAPDMPDATADSLVTTLQTPITFTTQDVTVIGEDLLVPYFSGAYNELEYDGTAFDDRVGDAGLDSLVLGRTSTNLAFSADAFTSGAASAGFTVAPVDVFAPSSGFVIAADTAGNVDSLAISFVALVPDETAPVLAGTYDGSLFEGTATDDHADAAGIASMTLGSSTDNLALDVDPFTVGDLTVAFRATPIDSLAAASGFVVAADTAGNTDSLFVEILPPAPDTLAPILAGTADGFTFSGNATERQADDRGLASIVLSADAANLTLTTDTFEAGADSVGFTATSVDEDLVGSGFVIATDVSGNADSLFVEIAARPADVTPPVLAGTADGFTFSGNATERQADDRGLASIVLSADAANLTLTTDTFEAGADSVGFTATSVDEDLVGSGFVIATDVSGNADSLFVEIAARPADVTPPALAGTADGFTFSGNATERQADDRGLASIVLSADAANLTLTTDTFEAGADSVGFTATSVDEDLVGSGFVIATDVSGNADSLFVEIAARPADVTPPALAGTADGFTFSGNATERQADDRGLASIVLSADAANLTLTTDTFEAGADSVGFTATSVDEDLVGSGFVIATDVSGNADSLFVEIAARPADVTPPALAGTADGFTFSGNATERQADDRGLASIVLSADAANLTLTTDTFEAGADSVGFTATSVDEDLVGSGFVIATDVSGNADSLFVEIAARPADVTPPVLAGTADGFTFSGNATERQADDRGLASIVLSADAANLTLTTDTFEAGADSVGFTATSVDEDLVGSGFVIATDVSGNADSLFVEIAARPADVTPPALAGTADGFTFSGNATERQADDRGLASIVLSADAANLTLTTDTFEAGADSVGFTATSVDEDLVGSGFVIATDVSGNADSLFVEIAARPADVTPPVLAGTADGFTFSGTATEDQPDDRGLATVTLSANATNLALDVGAFETGAASVGFAATAVDTGVEASGYVVATDVAGNADSVFVEILPPPDTTPPVLTGSVIGEGYEGTATDETTLDSGLASVALSADATNLALSVDPFTAGAPSASFSATQISSTAAGSGYVVATDVAGNADSVLVSLDAVPTFQYDLAATATYAYTTETSGTITVTVRNIGTDPMTKTRVVRQSASGATVDAGPITLGTINPGASKDAVFAFSSASAGATASFQAQDLVVRLNEGDTVNNDVSVTLEPVTDAAAPVVAGSTSGGAYDGTATDSQPDDTGLASVALGSEAVNLTIDVDPFTSGDPTVAFTATPTDPAQEASGYIVATDVAGNADSVFVAFVVPDTVAPELAGTYSRSLFEGTADDTEAGLASVMLGSEAVNLALDVDPFAPGHPNVAFRATPIDTLVAASGFVVAADTAGNTDSLFVEILPPAPDTQAPALAGSIDGFTFMGNATERDADDQGLATIALSADAANLTLSVDAFTAGADSAGFVATSADQDLAATGFVIATDVSGNADSLFVEIAARPADVTPPALAGAADGFTFSGNATERQADDRGLASIVLSADAANLTLTTDTFEAGADSVGFTATSVDEDLVGSGFVIATDVSGNADSLFVEIAARPADVTPPVVTGTLDAGTFSGTATEDQPDDRGLATVTLSANATNLALDVGAFETGAASVGFAATAVDTGVEASGYVVATDVAGNADSVLVSLDAVPTFQYDLAATATYAYTTETSGTITVTVRNIGTDPMTKTRVVRQSASGATVDAGPITLGTINPGASKDAVFAFSSASAGATASFQAQDLVVRFNEGNTANNNTTVVLESGGSARVSHDSDTLEETDEGLGAQPETTEDLASDQARPDRDAAETDASTNAPTREEASSDPTQAALDSSRSEGQRELDGLDEANPTESRTEPAGKPELASDTAREDGTNDVSSRDAPAGADLGRAGKPSRDVADSASSGGDRGEPSVSEPALPAYGEALPTTLAMRLYPNPGRHQRTLDVAVPVDTEVQLALTDVLGRHVGGWTQVLTAGHHTVGLDMGPLAAGPYVLRVTAGREHAVVRLTVLP